MAKTPSPRKPRAPRASARPRLPKAIQAVVDAARDKKAIGVVVLDLRKSDAFTDFFVLCSGSNPRQVQAIADAVDLALRAQHQKPAAVEGYSGAEWILMDYFDFVVHIFSSHARDFYALDRLWGNAKRTDVGETD